MRLIRFGEFGQERPGVMIEGKRLDLSDHFTDWNGSFFEAGGLASLKDFLDTNIESLNEVPKSERWGSPVARPWKVICIGLNYSDHALEAGMPIPAEPIVFMKTTNTVVGPYDDVFVPRGSQKTDWEVELGIVIGKSARYLNSIEEAENHIAGYCISHDVSERAFQLERGGQWTKGKSCDTFNPLGPWVATKEEIQDPHNLTMQLRVNGEMKQNGNTKTMIFNSFFIVHYLSQFMTLEAGDVISSGTPPGVGMGFKPPQYLKAGDIVELSIDGLGSQKQVFQQA